MVLLKEQVKFFQIRAPHEHPLVFVKIVQLLEVSNYEINQILGLNIQKILGI
jgi:hypothetical protein